MKKHFWINWFFSKNTILPLSFPAKSDIYRSHYSPPARRCDRLGTTEEGHVGCSSGRTSFPCCWLVILSGYLTFPVNCQELIGQENLGRTSQPQPPKPPTPELNLVDSNDWLDSCEGEVRCDWMEWGWLKGKKAEIETDSIIRPETDSGPAVLKYS